MFSQTCWGLRSFHLSHVSKVVIKCPYHHQLHTQVLSMEDINPALQLHFWSNGHINRKGSQPYQCHQATAGSLHGGWTEQMWAKLNQELGLFRWTLVLCHQNYSLQEASWHNPNTNLSLTLAIWQDKTWLKTYTVWKSEMTPELRCPIHSESGNIHGYLDVWEATQTLWKVHLVWSSSLINIYRPLWSPIKKLDYKLWKRRKKDGNLQKYATEKSPKPWLRRPSKVTDQENHLPGGEQ